MSTFLAISPEGFGGYYGRGESVEDAKAELKKAGGNLVRYLVLLLPDGAEEAHVDHFGGVTWTWAEGADRDGKAQEVFRRGVPKPPSPAAEQDKAHAGSAK